MPSTKTKQPTLQLTISLSEVEGLRSKVAELDQENAELKTENDALKKQIHSLTDPQKKAAAAAFKKARGYR